MLRPLWHSSLKMLSEGLSTAAVAAQLLQIPLPALEERKSQRKEEARFVDVLSLFADALNATTESGLREGQASYQFCSSGRHSND